jgi:hypothetical protein
MWSWYDLRSIFEQWCRIWSEIKIKVIVPASAPSQAIIDVIDEEPNGSSKNSHPQYFSPLQMHDFSPFPARTILTKGSPLPAFGTFGTMPLSIRIGLVKSPTTVTSSKRAMTGGVAAKIKGAGQGGAKLTSPPPLWHLRQKLHLQ